MDAFDDTFSKPLLPGLKYLFVCNILVMEQNVSFFRRKILLPLKWFPVLCYIICAYLHLILDDVIHQSFIEFIEGICIAIIVSQGLFKAVALVKKLNELREIITELGNIWRTKLTENQVERKNSIQKWLNPFISVLYYANISLSIQFVCTPLQIMLFKTLILHQEFEFLLPTRIYLPADYTNNWAVNIVTYVFVGYSLLLAAFSFMGTDMILIGLCAQISTEFLLLQEDLLCTKSGLQEDSEKHIKTIIIKHQKLILISEKLDAIFNKIIFVNFICISITLGFFGFLSQIVRSPTDIIKCMVGLIGMLMSIFLISFFAELLAKCSSQIADSAYESEWYNDNLEHRKLILIIIMRSQKPCHITSLGMSPITINSFSKVMSTTWSYISLIRSVYDENNV